MMKITFIFYKLEIYRPPGDTAELRAVK